MVSLEACATSKMLSALIMTLDELTTFVVFCFGARHVRPVRYHLIKIETLLSWPVFLLC